MRSLPEPRTHRNLRDCTGSKVSENELFDLIVKKLCYLDGAYQLMSDKRCLDIWNNYYYGGDLFADELC